MSNALTRNGFTLVEIVVALFVFSVGALALAATGAVIAREMTTNSLRERAALVAANRMEIIRSQCSAASGEEVRRGVKSTWSAGLSQSGSLLAEAAVTSPRLGAETGNYQLTIACGP